MNGGIVYLVGAGPGDPRLITLRGIDCIKKAEVLVYDRLVNQSLLDYASLEAEKIFVGKRPDHHALPQEEINKLLAEKALQNKIVVRLKGGDPFVFGRGGEEAQVLAEHGIPFEVVPGITSAVAVPAYAGIPVTHRGYASGFSVITGHEEDGKEGTAIQWDKLASGKDTLIFLMGVKNIELIVDQLVSRGKPGHTPVALVRWGTLGRQEVLRGTLDNIVSIVKESNFKPPAVIIVGEVINLRETLKWWENKPLSGRGVVITRPHHLQGGFREKILELGGEPVSVPAVKVLPPRDYSLLDGYVKEVNKFNWIIFTSINGVEYFFNRLKVREIDFRELKGVKLAAIGPKTGEAIKNLGLKVEFQPSEYRAEAVAQGLKDIANPGEVFLLPRADIARLELPRALREMGMKVYEVATYYNVLPEDRGDIAFEELLSGRKKPIITFSSSSTVRNFFKLLGEGGSDMVKGAVLASIGPVTSETIRSYGLNVDIEATRYTMEGLLEGILNYTKNNKK